jgi:hypothetical protein
MDAVALRAVARYSRRSTSCVAEDGVAEVLRGVRGGSGNWTGTARAIFSTVFERVELVG